MKSTEFLSVFSYFKYTFCAIVNLLTYAVLHVVC